MSWHRPDLQDRMAIREIFFLHTGPAVHRPPSNSSTSRTVDLYLCRNGAVNCYADRLASGICAKVRCLVSQRLDRCNRCLANDNRCVFAQPKRARDRGQPYAHPTHVAASHSQANKQYMSSEGNGIPTTAPVTPAGESLHSKPSAPDNTPQAPVIAAAVPANIIGALASLRARRGAALLLATPGSIASGVAQAPESMSLSSLLHPLGQPSSVPPVTGRIKMPSYSSSMTLGHTITDPIEGGILDSEVSKSFYDFFMLEMNAKWVFLLDATEDTHDSVRTRSPLLFVTVLLCSSKFLNVRDDGLDSGPDPFLQARLCTLARSLVINALAAGDRSIETIQALYLLVCWKDVDDDISFLHTGYAYHVLQNMNVPRKDVRLRDIARRRRMLLALFGPDKPQDMTEDPSLSDPEGCSRTPGSTQLDLIACSCTDLRRIEGRLLNLVDGSSEILIRCVEDMLDGELRAWRSKWTPCISSELDEQATINSPSLDPHRQHLRICLALWEQSTRLRVGFAILRRSVMAALGQATCQDHNRPSQADPYLIFDVAGLQSIPTRQLVGVRSSLEGAFGTLGELLRFHPHELRRAPDVLLLLIPTAALVLCLLLCLQRSADHLPGPAFQRRALALIHGMAQHIASCVQSPQDSVVLHSTYLDSLIQLLGHSGVTSCSQRESQGAQQGLNALSVPAGAEAVDIDGLTVQAAGVLADGMPVHQVDSGHHLHEQVLTDDLLWDIPVAGDSVAND
ncbi:hypothetical protein BDV19DRAFT_390615 [Aspergillus venezuelensis]